IGEAERDPVLIAPAGIGVEREGAGERLFHFVHGVARRGASIVRIGTAHRVYRLIEKQSYRPAPLAHLEQLHFEIGAGGAAGANSVLVAEPELKFGGTVLAGDGLLNGSENLLRQPFAVIEITGMICIGT